MKKLTLLTALAFIGASASAQAQLLDTVIHLEGPSQTNDYNPQYNNYPVNTENPFQSGNTTATLATVAAFVANTTDGSNTYGNLTTSPTTSVNYLRYSYEDDADSFALFSPISGSNTTSYLGADAAGVGFNGNDVQAGNVGGTDTATANTGFIFNSAGVFDVTTAGTFTFTLAADDAANITIDGTSILQADYSNTSFGVDYSTNPPTVTPTTVSASVTLAAGSHSFDLLYFQNGGGEGLSYNVSSSNGGVFDYTLAPEPSTIAMMAFGALGLGVIAYRRRAALI